MIRGMGEGPLKRLQTSIWTCLLSAVSINLHGVFAKASTLVSIGVFQSNRILKKKCIKTHKHHKDGERGSIYQFHFSDRKPHLSTFLKLGVVRSSSFELFARLMNASSPTCFFYIFVLLQHWGRIQHSKEKYYWIIIFWPVHRHLLFQEQLPPPGQPGKQLIIVHLYLFWMSVSEMCVTL